MTSTWRIEAAKSTRPPLVVFAPFPPARSGIARYVEELMPYLLTKFDITLVLSDGAPVPECFAKGLHVLLASEFRAHRKHFEQVPKLYHFGDNPDHRYMLELIGRDPGVVVLHDFNLNYLHRAAIPNWGEGTPFRAVMAREYGLAGGTDMQWQYGQPDCSVFSTYEQPLNGDVLDAATGVIAHSRYVQYKVAARARDIPVWYVPHHLSPSVAEFAQLTKAAARAQLGLPPGELIITALGFITRAKQIGLLLASLSKLRASLPPFRFILAGEKRPGEYDVDADIAQFGMQNITLCTGHLSEVDFFGHLAACDVVANLRYPTGGETSGTLIRALGMGVPTIILDNGPIGELPDAVVKKVSWDEQAPAALTSVLRELLTDATSRQRLGASAAAYIRERHGIEDIARRYSKIIGSALVNPKTRVAPHFKQYFPAPRATARRFRAMGDEALAKTEHADGFLWWRAASTPLGGGIGRALVVSPRPHQTAQLLRSLFDWPTETVTAVTFEEFTGEKLREPDGSPIGVRTFLFVLAVTDADLPDNTAALLVRRLNAALCIGGALTLETRQSLEPHCKAAPLGAARLPRCLNEAGFGDVRAVSPQDLFHSGHLSSMQQLAQSWSYGCVAARKVSDFALWRFIDEMDGPPMRLGGRIS